MTQNGCVAGHCLLISIWKASFGYSQYIFVVITAGKEENLIVYSIFSKWYKQPLIQAYPLPTGVFQPKGLHH